MVKVMALDKWSVHRTALVLAMVMVRSTAQVSAHPMDKVTALRMELELVMR